MWHYDVRSSRRWGSRERPRWTRDGTEIVYLHDDNTLMAAEVRASGDSLEIGAVTRLFDVDVGGETHWDVTADGERFLINPSLDRGRADSALQLAVHWPVMLEER